MAFDAAFLSSVLAEINASAEGARVEKITQPEKDEIVLLTHTAAGGKKLLFHLGGSNPRVGFQTEAKASPAKPPMFCMLLRKHLTGARLKGAEQFGFERACRFRFESRDEMGFPCERQLIAEIMGTYSNLIFTDGDGKILSALKPIDFATSSVRQILPGMKYELPPSQGKTNPLELDEGAFLALLQKGSPDMPGDVFLSRTLQGLSSSVCRELCFLACGVCDAPLGSIRPDRLLEAFRNLRRMLLSRRSSPCMVLHDGKPQEYAFLPLTQYKDLASFELVSFPSCSALLETFYAEKDRVNHIRQSASDLVHLLTNAQNRIAKKLQLQKEELKRCEKADSYKKTADLITSNLFALRQSKASVTLTDYSDWNEEKQAYAELTVALDTRLSPAANAQAYYRKYTKACNARIELSRQIELGEAELTYLSTVSDALDRAATEQDFEDLRAELQENGYASRVRRKDQGRKTASAPLRYRTSGGLEVLCGKNNLQNDRLSFKVASRFDYWFHVKNMPGSHVILLCDRLLPGQEPSEQDFTEAAQIAACNSKGADADFVTVDYTLVRNLKKPPAAKPGYVIYHTNWSAYIKPDRKLVQSLLDPK